MNEFEKYPELAKQIQEYAAFSKFTNWQIFTDVLNETLAKLALAKPFSPPTTAGDMPEVRELPEFSERCKLACKSDHEDGDTDRETFQKQGFYRGIDQSLGKLLPIISSQQAEIEELKNLLMKQDDAMQGETRLKLEIERLKAELEEVREYVRGQSLCEGKYQHVYESILKHFNQSQKQKP